MGRPPKGVADRRGFKGVSGVSTPKSAKIRMFLKIGFASVTCFWIVGPKNNESSAHTIIFLIFFFEDDTMMDDNHGGRWFDPDNDNGK